MSDPPSRHVHLIAPALLVVTALVQIALVKLGPLTPWRGGGFGLFSTVDKMENRIVQVWVETPSGDVPFPVHDFGREVQGALAFPTEGRLLRLGERFAEERTEGRALRVEVWKRTFDLATGESRRERVASRTVSLVR